jgi:glycosyltransferase involved in cell wall biosynthesis
MPNNLIFFTKYTKLGASSRYRSFQYRLYFEKHYDVKFFPLFPDKYIAIINNGKNKFLLFIIFSYIKRLFLFFKYLNRNNIFFIEYELFPYFPSIFEILLHRLKIKFILDYDDAIFHNYDLNTSPFIRLFYKNKIPNIISYSNLVITGSPYLTKFSLNYNKETFEIPTSIPFFKYQNRNNYLPNKLFTIGWIGSKFTSKNIMIIYSALLKFSKTHDCIIKLIGFDKNLSFFNSFNNVEIINWCNNTEIDELYTFDVGIMPLYDLPFERGKCGFKLIQYMACGIPTISTPLEANVKIDNNNGNLFARNEQEWIECFQNIFNNRDYFKNVGKKNKFTALDLYSIESNQNKYIQLFNTI